MARVFLDTNAFIDTVVRRPEIKILESLERSTLHISPLSIHIYCYSYKIKIPNHALSKQTKKFQVIEFDQAILNSATEGPTEDFEDNVQLHSGAAENCDIFLTNDKDLLKMTFFGQMKIQSSL